MKGLLFDKLIGEEEPSVAIPDMPNHLADHPEKFQGFVSTYTIDSFFGSWLEVGTMQGWYKHQYVPATASF